MALSVGALGASSFPDGIEFMGSYLDDVSRSSYTFTDVDFGPEYAGREIVVASSLKNAFFTSVTIGGTVADELLTGGASNRILGIARRAVPTGTSGTIVVTPSTTSTRCSIFVYRVTRKTTGNYSDSQDFNTTTSSTSITFGSVTVPSGGVIVGVGNLTETSTVTISGGDALLGGKTDSTNDTGETDFSFYLDGTNYTTSTTPSINASWGISQFRFALAVAL